MIGVRKTFSVILAIEFILACGSVYVELSGLERKVHLPSAPVMDRENEEWCVVTVDDSVVVHGTTSIGVDSSNYPHISYYDTTNGDLKYARWTGDRWSLETVDSEDDVGRSSSLAIDSEDNPHIAYSHINTTSYLRSYLKYTSWNGSSWLVEIVDSSPGVGYGDSIALDSSNLPHIAYADLHRHWLRYAHSTVSGWSIETIDAIEYQWPIFQWGSIAINSTDEPHLVYSTPPGKGTDLRYAYHADSDWNIETVMTSEKWISHSSIAFDSFGYPHLSFWDFEFYLWYARWNGSDWVFEIVDSASDWISTFTHLSLDSNDFPHIAYQAEEFGLKYASWNGSAWTIETIPDTQAHHASLTLDSLDKTHISFSTRDWTLKYATRGPCPENKPPISDAGPNQIVNEGDIVFFDGSSSYDADGNITNYSWDFDASIDNDGDGNYTNDVDATGPAPTHVYYDDGVYLVTLKVTDSSGLSDWDTCNITVLNVPPIPEWTSRSSDGTIPNPPYPEGKEILFEATIYDPGIYDTFTYDWDFGDGTILLDAGPSVVHAYGDNDTYIVVLTVTDDDGGVGIDDTPPLLTTNENPIPSISLTLCIFFEGTTPCEAIGEFSDPGWLDTHSAVWNYGDGTYETAVLTEENDPPDATGMNITSHIYGDNGDYNLTFTVVDDDGGVGTTWAEVYVENLPPSFLIDVPASMNEGEDFILGIMATDPGSDDLIININWGDGTSETKTYYNNGIGPDPPNSGEGTYPFTVYSNLTHTYGDNGNFTITVSVEDDDGSSVQDATIIEVINLPPEIGLPIGPLFYNEGEQFTLAAIGTDPGSDDINFTWTLELGPSWSAIYYNDGVAPDPPLSPWGTFPFVAVDTINHTYGDNGYYNVTITATDDDGGESTSVFSIEVRNLEPSLDIGGPYAGDENSPIVFTATATDQGSDDLTFTWDWGDGTTDAVVFYNDGIGPDPLKSPWGIYPFHAIHTISHIWGDNGNFTVTLIVVDDDGGTTTSQTIVVIDNIDPTISNLTYEVFYNVPRTQGYWDFQCTEKLPSPDHVGIQQEFIDYISSHSRVFSGISTKDEVCDYLGNLDSSNMTQKAMQQLMALWLNVASNKLNLSSEMFIPQLNMTMNLWELIVWIEDTILNDEDNMETAKDLADEINNGNLIPYAVLTFWGTASDPGSDDLVFAWNWGDGTSTEHIYYNDGVGPDPYPSPDINPIMVTDAAMHSYSSAGTYTITLTVMDDDGGSATLVLTLTI